MKTTPLTGEQERMRLEGLRRLARIIARSTLVQPGRNGSAATPHRPSDGGESPAERKDGAA